LIHINIIHQSISATLGKEASTKSVKKQQSKKIERVPAIANRMYNDRRNQSFNIPGLLWYFCTHNQQNSSRFHTYISNGAIEN
jgi:hypothetical protein